MVYRYSITVFYGYKLSFKDLFDEKIVEENGCDHNIDRENDLYCRFCGKSTKKTFIQRKIIVSYNDKHIPTEGILDNYDLQLVIDDLTKYYNCDVQTNHHSKNFHNYNKEFFIGEKLWENYIDSFDYQMLSFDYDHIRQSKKMKNAENLMKILGKNIVNPSLYFINRSG